MKTFGLIFNIFILSFTLQAQDFPNLISTSKVTTIGYWAKGETKKYHVTKTDETSVNGKSDPSKNTSSTYDFELKVIDSTAHSYILELKYLTTSITGIDQKLEGMVNTFVKGHAVRYQTDEFGVYMKMLNLDFLAKEFQKQCDQYKKQVTANKKPEEVKSLSKIIDNIKLEFSKPENMEVLYINDVLAIHGFYGLELTLNKPIDIETEIPCLMDIVLHCPGKITLQTINKPKDQAVTAVKSKPSQEELKEYMKRMYALMFPEDVKAANIADFKIDFEDVQKFILSLSSGWMQSIETTRTTSISVKTDKIKKVSKVVFTMM